MKWAIGGIVVLVLGVGIWWTTKPKNNQIVKPGEVNNEELPDIQTGEAPWGKNIERLRERLVLMKMQVLEEEGMTYHMHQHLDILVEGKPIEIPAGIGINSGEEFVSALHTHDTSGVIHVESPVIETFTLGQFFGVWGVKLSNECIGSYCNVGDKQWRMYSNGHEWSGTFGSFILRPYQEIVLAYGTEAQLPNPMPASYDFGKEF